MLSDSIVLDESGVLNKLGALNDSVVSDESGILIDAFILKELVRLYELCAKWFRRMNQVYWLNPVG